jgi:hypothetical protein
MSFGKTKNPRLTWQPWVWKSGLSLVLDEASHGRRAHVGQMPLRHLNARTGAHSFNCDERYVHFFTPTLVNLSAGVNFY